MGGRVGVYDTMGGRVYDNMEGGWKGEGGVRRRWFLPAEGHHRRGRVGVGGYRGVASTVAVVPRRAHAGGRGEPLAVAEVAPRAGETLRGVEIKGG